MEMGEVNYLVGIYKKTISLLKLMASIYNLKIQNFLYQNHQFYFQKNKKILKKMDIRKKLAFY